MPTPSGNSLTTINAAKELEESFQPLLLVEIGPFDDGAMLYLSTENLDSTDQGFPYGGKDYKPRVINQDVGAVAAVSDNGIVQSPQISIELADADNFLWSQYEMPDDRGFKGCKVVLKFVFWDAGTGTFSSDSRNVFVGICNAPASKDAARLTISATSLLRMDRVFLPTVRIQRRCPWIFPETAADRVLAANDEDSDFYECGYSPDVGGDNARGNGSFTKCGGTWEECVERMGNSTLPVSSTDAGVLVQIEEDQSGRRTGRFGGIRFDAPDGWRGRSFASGDKEEGLNVYNDGKYNDFFPHVLGKSFVEPPVMNVLGEANSTRFEAVIAVGKIHDDNTTPGPVEVVLVNDFYVPHISETKDPLLSWEWVNTGDRDGSVNRMPLYDGKGDPYGSLACIVIVVHRKMHDSASLPRVRVLTQGPALRIYEGGDGGFERSWTMNPSWITAELLTWGPWREELLHLQSFADEASYCNPMVSYTNLVGEDVEHPRYQAGITLRDRRSLADILAAFLAGFKAMLRPDPATGKLELLIRKTLADQQGSPISGSNDNNGVVSATAEGSPATGYVAYHFRPSEILWLDGKPAIRIEQKPIAESPNRLACPFQDQDFFFTNDTAVKIDAEDIGRAGQEVASTLTVEGVVNWDQSYRAIETRFAEHFRGNPRSGANGKNDTGGTWIVELVSTSRCVHLRVGDIIGVTFPKLGLETMQLFRVLALQPSSNYETCRIRAMWHEDDWYLDSYGQNPVPLLQQQRRNRLRRPPFGWSPNYTVPPADMEMFEKTEKTFAVSQRYQAAADSGVVAKVAVAGYLPVNSFSKKVAPPYAPTATIGSGGDYPEGTYYFAMTAMDEDGFWSPPSFPLAKANVPANGSVTIPNIYWQSGTQYWKLYGGKNPNKLTLQAEGGGTPPSVTATEYKASNEGMPDVQFSHLRFRVKKVYHAGVWGAVIKEVTGSTMKFEGVAFEANQWAGYDASVIARWQNEGDIGRWDFRITGNSADTLTIQTTFGTDLLALGIAEGDVVVMRARANIASEDTIGDSNFVNGVDYYDPPVGVLWVSGDAFWLEFGVEGIRVETVAPHNLSVGDKVYLRGTVGVPEAWGEVTEVFTTTSFHFEGINDQVDPPAPFISSGEYLGGGVITRITNGMAIDEEEGRLVRIIAGTGRGQVRRIKSNTATTLTIEGKWDILPDNTSRFIIEEESWISATDTTPVENANPDRLTYAEIDIDNYREQTLLVKAYTRSADGRESIDPDSPERDIYIFGGAGTPIAVPGFEKATALVEDTSPGALSNVMPVRRAGTIVDAEIVATEAASPGQRIVIDLRVQRKGQNDDESLFPNAPPEGEPGDTMLILPAGAEANVIYRNMVFVNAGVRLELDDLVWAEVIEGDGIARVTCVLKWATDVITSGLVPVAE